MADRYRWHLMSDMLQRKRAILIAKLGGCCVQCSEDDPDKLEFHHPDGKSWRSNRVSRWVRLHRYEQEAAAGLIQLLCDACHNNPNDHPDTCFCPHCRGESDF